MTEASSNSIIDVGGMKVPFDAEHLAFSNLSYFDVPYRGRLVGSTVRITDVTVSAWLYDDASQHFPELIGEVVAHCFDRIVVTIPGAGLYMGWFGPNEFSVLDLFHGWEHIPLQ